MTDDNDPTDTVHLSAALMRGGELNAALHEIRRLQDEHRRLIGELTDRTLAHGDLRRLYESLVEDIRKAGDEPDGEAFRRLACEHIEILLRDLDVSEVRLWRQPWYGGFNGERYSVTLTYRSDNGEVHGASLHDALRQATSKGGTNGAR